MSCIVLRGLCTLALALLSVSLPESRGPRNIIIFVAEGLRHDAVNPQHEPTLSRLPAEGVHFANSYSLFPSFTTANALAIATAHLLGDIGDFSNTVWAGHTMFDSGISLLPEGTPVPFLENDQVLAE